MAGPRHFLAAFRFVDVVALALVLGIYLTFTIFLWGTVYYHLRIGTPWTNFTRFWRLVLENPDPTSGNFLEQIPKTASPGPRIPALGGAPRPETR